MVYPKELRQRVIEKDAEGLTQTEIAEELSVSQSWVNKILKMYYAAVCIMRSCPRIPHASA